MGQFGLTVQKSKVDSINWNSAYHDADRVIALAYFRNAMAKIPSFKDKLIFYSFFSIKNNGVQFKKKINHKDFDRITTTYHLNGRKKQAIREEKHSFPYQKIHYGCGSTIFDDWLNVDFYGKTRSNFLQADLTLQHPFADNSFDFAFSEDFLEHLDQANSILFLSEVYRTLKPKGVIRLSFPGLEGVLQKHFTAKDFSSYFVGYIEAYEIWDHLHFYSRQELQAVAKHIGFSSIHFSEFGKSEHGELQNLDTREHQSTLNTYAELTK